MEAILYLDRSGCAWRYLPADFPPWRTVYGYFAAWRDDGTLAQLHDQLRAWNLRRACTRVRLVWADAGYTTGKLAAWAAMRMTVQIVAKRDRYSFEVLPRRWVVERTLCLDQQAPQDRAGL